ncbi:MAG TPA: hypothetical protein DCY48_02735 [Candidatus Magasanikbacteria bacterium]|nr:MAG: hypothetical protein A3I74_02095 [Candidatus Magasanikbacteria bacterium RIFCSPLOWO2_02_FULL_47_16]OGH79694.1 MAG: hypothetical protein A3C10_01310 [Candidatus Magasanikbacteria bacterium RIFCSPHIGHO2_02_FULL_48_18]OGH82862.1 MAG: hypothetical protein A3G08_00835 [Candidatus Magasanikbacteria bacterium RIFCSPLOWO2_12_FULL_47_9b]HAZ28668.1 hypothetical protein [Candidatus Magasanikbacteria bacterium]
MKQAVITVKIEPEVKKKAQKVAKQLGLSLSGVVNIYLHQFIDTKSILFSKRELEELEEDREMLQSKELKRRAKEVRDGWIPEDQYIPLKDLTKKYGL